MYYNIELEYDPKIIGVNNGMYQVELDKRAYDKKTYAQVDTLFLRNEFTTKQTAPKIDIKFYFKKLKSAQKTSFISFCPYLNHCHFLIQKNLLELFKNFNIQNYTVFETVIYDSPNENIDNTYYLFYLVLQDWDVIDFKNTVFTYGGYGKYPEIERTFVDENEMKNFKFLTKVKTLALTKTFDRSLDFFHTRLGGLFVSEKLKRALEESNVTGIKFHNDVQVLVL